MNDLIQQIISRNLKYYLEKYEGHKFDGNKTLCPFHNDTSPSMTVDEKAGSWLWYCHSCNEGGNIITYYMKKHNTTKGQAVEELAGIFNLDYEKKKPVVKKPVIVATYPYLDEQGKQLYKIIRYKPKTFRADKKLDNIKQIPYRLPEILKANEVWLVEGEKDVDNVHKIGLTATTAPFGKKQLEARIFKIIERKRSQNLP